VTFLHLPLDHGTRLAWTDPCFVSVMNCPGGTALTRSRCDRPLPLRRRGWSQIKENAKFESGGSTQLSSLTPEDRNEAAERCETASA